MSAQPPSQTIVLIHGLWETPRSWEHWITRYEGRGHRVLAPAWPGMEAEVEELRRDPSPMTTLGLAQVVDHYDQIVRGLDSPPIIMGHSFGGTVVQVLLDRGLGSAGVGIASGPVKGMFHVPFSALRVVAPVLFNPFKYRRATGLTRKQFHYAFANTMTRQESDAAYERHHIPAVNRLLFQGAFANFKPNGPVEVNFHNHDRAPLLLIAGGEDHSTPAKLNRHNVEKYRDSMAITAYEEFPGRSHFTVGQPGWEQVADYALGWATNPRTGPAEQSDSVSNLTVTGHQHTA